MKVSFLETNVTFFVALISQYSHLKRSSQNSIFSTLAVEGKTFITNCGPFGGK